MKIYRGVRTGNKCRVFVNENAKWIELPPRLDLVNHSPTGFEWGYGGSGSAQLALAILADCYGDNLALEYYQQFKWDVITDLKTNYWVLKKEQIDEWKEGLKSSVVL